jgi:hypothetical protein
MRTVYEIYFKVTIDDTNWEKIALYTDKLEELGDLLKALKKLGGYEYVSINASGPYKPFSDVLAKD